MSLCATCRARARARAQIHTPSQSFIQTLRLLTNNHTVETGILQPYTHARYLSISRTTRDKESSQPAPGIPPSASAQPKAFATRDLGAFYNDLINPSSPNPPPHQPTQSPASTTSPSPSSSPALPDWIPTSPSRTDVTARAAQLFSSIEGSGYVSSNAESDPNSTTWQTINGVRVPPRPREPENCCMSGCVNCVWDDYRIDVEAWAARVRDARARGGNKKVDMMDRADRAVKNDPPSVSVSASASASVSSSMDDDGGGSEALWSEAGSGSESTTSIHDLDGDELFSDIPVGIREFMANEKRIRERKRAKRKEKDVQAMTD